MKCPVCYGTGVQILNNRYTGLKKKIKCPACGGSGKVTPKRVG